MGLSEYYRLLSDFYETLKVFRSWNAFWKASVLTATDLVVDEDLFAEKQAGAAWEKLEEIYTRLSTLHRTLGIPGTIVEMPIDEWEECVIPLAAQGGDEDE
jgi:hypothetical protein